MKQEKYEVLFEVDTDPVEDKVVKLALSQGTAEWAIIAPDGTVETHTALDDMVKSLRKWWKEGFVYSEAASKDPGTTIMVDEVVKKICRAETQWFIEDKGLGDAEVLIELQSPLGEAVLLLRKGDEIFLVEHAFDSMPFTVDKVQLDDCLLCDLYKAIFPNAQVPENCPDKECYWLAPTVGRHYVARISPWLAEQFSRIF